MFTKLINKLKLLVARRINTLRQHLIKASIGKTVWQIANLKTAARNQTLKRMELRAAKMDDVEKITIQGLLDLAKLGGVYVDKLREKNPKAKVSRQQLIELLKSPAMPKVTQFVVLKLEAAFRNVIILTEHGRVAYIYHDLSKPKPRFIAHIYPANETIEDGEELEFQIGSLETTRYQVRNFPPRMKSIDHKMINTVLSLMHKDCELFQFVEDFEAQLTKEQQRADEQIHKADAAAKDRFNPDSF